MNHWLPTETAPSQVHLFLHREHTSTFVHVRTFATTFYSGVIDYIFVTGNVNVLSATVTPSDFHGLQMTDCQWESSWPSDHAMVVAELDLKTGTGIE